MQVQSDSIRISGERFHAHKWRTTPYAQMENKHKQKIVTDYPMYANEVQIQTKNYKLEDNIYRYPKNGKSGDEIYISKELQIGRDIHIQRKL